MTTFTAPSDLRSPPLVVHILHRFDCGGLQSVLAECINHMPAQRFRHAVVCLAGYTEYAERIRAVNVDLYTLDEPPGHNLSTHIKLWKLLRRLRPAIVHTYNIGAIEHSLTALLAWVPVRIHAEHGRGSVEIDGKHRKYNLLRRILSPIVSAFVPVSDDLAAWLRDVVKVSPRRIFVIRNGVDTSQFAPRTAKKADATEQVCIGTVGRIDCIKNHAGLIDAFRLLLIRFPAPAYDLRLVIVGDGPLLNALNQTVDNHGIGDRVLLTGARSDVAALLRDFSLFVLPSFSEGTPMTILEAMATALPVVASRVGGVPQLVLNGRTGALVEPGDITSLADALGRYISDSAMRSAHGAAGRTHVEARCSVEAMVASYTALYDAFLQRRARPECSDNERRLPI